jgi:UDP-glucuronate 4-epimerase
MKILVTGAAGFIGYHTARCFLAEGEQVAGIDNLNGYYDPRLKRARLANLSGHAGFSFTQLDITNRVATERFFDATRPEMVIHLAAQPGVRHSVTNPHVYAETNLTGFLHILEGVRRCGVRRLIYASSSSASDTPSSLYGATKRANELMAHCYTHLYKFPATGLRFFTVYGPWGRPDMAPVKFARAIALGERIDVYNYGRMRRDFTYIDDIVEGVRRLAGREIEGHRVFNIGNSSPVELMEFIHALENTLGRKARKRFVPMQAGDVTETCADVGDLFAFTGFRPTVAIHEGVERFVKWFQEYYELGTSDTHFAISRAS